MTTSRYSRLSLKMKTIEDELLHENESPFSSNMVTGESINFPIAQTCRPTRVCAQTCYAACGPITWTASLKKQLRVYNSCRADPLAFAKKVIKYRKSDFITWNGSGDLFEQSIQALDIVAVSMPEIPIWVRTRIPFYAAMVKNRPNVFLHFSLDRHSMSRLTSIAELGGIKAKHHYSYQYDADEVGSYPNGVKIVFGHDYQLPVGVDGPEVCPLNQLSDITNACQSCRRCFQD